jgi:hypothetical protein
MTSKASFKLFLKSICIWVMVFGLYQIIEYGLVMPSEDAIHTFFGVFGLITLFSILSYWATQPMSLR